MERIAGRKVYKISDVVAALAPMRHISETDDVEKRYYSYGGVSGLLRKKFPAQRPIPHGAYLPLDRVPEAVAALNTRPRSPSLAWKEVAPVMLAGVAMVNLELFAQGVGRSLSNIRKVFYADNSPIRHLFIDWGGGFALTQEEYKELLAWIPRFGNGPRPTKFRKNPQKRRGARLNYSKIVVAKAATPTQEGEPEL